MPDANTPSVFTQPGGDADDVLGHRVLANATDEPAGIRARDRVVDKASFADDDDVEGHRVTTSDRVMMNDTGEDDVEGHRAAF